MKAEEQERHHTYSPLRDFGAIRDIWGWGGVGGWGSVWGWGDALLGPCTTALAASTLCRTSQAADKGSCAIPACPFACLQDKPGMKVGVVGLGGLGHMALKLAKAFGCEVRADGNNGVQWNAVERSAVQYTAAEVEWVAV